MKAMTFSEIADAENGQQIPSFTGRIKKVFPQKTDVGQYGQWWLQNIILQDDHANEITVTWCCEDAWTPDNEGKTLSFESGYDKKDQLCGIKKEIKRKGDKVYESVKVDDRAKVKTYEPNPLDEKGEHEHPVERPKNAPQSPPASHNYNGEIANYAAHAVNVFAAAWDASKLSMALIPDKDAEELSLSDWYDLRLRIAQGFAIEINKIIRKERF